MPFITFCKHSANIIILFVSLPSIRSKSFFGTRAAHDWKSRMRSFPELGLHKRRLAPICASLRTRRGRSARSGRGDRWRGDRLGRCTGRLWRVLARLAPLAAVQPLAEGLPARKPLVHEGVEPRPVVVDLSIGRRPTAQAIALHSVHRGTSAERCTQSSPAAL